MCLNDLDVSQAAGSLYCVYICIWNSPICAATNVEPKTDPVRHMAVKKTKVVTVSILPMTSLDLAQLTLLAALG